MAERPETDARYAFLDYLRALAAWLVVWDHLANIVPASQHLHLPLAQWVRNNVTGPLGIIQDFGWFGVALFFLISGFIISDRAAVESPYRFVVRRVLRIYPMLAVATFVSMALGMTAPLPSLGAIALTLTLANYLIYPQIVLVGVAWTLIIEVIFYVMTAVSQAARGSPHRIVFNLAFVALVIWARGAFGRNFGLFATAAGYIPILVMGQTVYWWLEKKRLSAPVGLAYLLAAAAVFLWSLRAMHPEFLPAANSYFISVAYALLLFIALLHAKLPERRVVRFLSETSYSLYLLHGIVGQLLLVTLMPRMPLSLAISFAAAVSLAAACVTYWLVERPTQGLARRLTTRRAA
jgi:peptidoglycan/LPS O-acetylase OafA/YrhL